MPHLMVIIIVTIEWPQTIIIYVTHGWFLIIMKKQYRNLEIRKFEKNDHIEWAIKHLGNIIEWSFQKIWAWPVSLI